jgi:alpha-D-ribose 1-methylphosphonate 5-triphosphate synthase subunit PhnG
MNDSGKTMTIVHRARWMSALALAESGDIDELGDLCDTSPATPGGATWLRPPETGLVMVRGRSDGRGAPFNLGEMAVTRCALRLADGTVGSAYIRGRDRRHAERAALVDALLQQAEHRGELDAALRTWIEPLEARRQRRLAERAAMVLDSRVEFFTVVRGETNA